MRKGLLGVERLNQILEKYDLEVNFYLHAKFQEYADTFKSISKRIHKHYFEDHN